jgi:hypothetical protein
MCCALILSCANSASSSTDSTPTLSLGAQTGTITAGTAGSATFAVATLTVSLSANAGKTWSSATLPMSAHWESATYGGGTFVAIAGGFVAATTIAATSP